MRLRITLHRGPSRSLVLADTPHPKCWRCDGDGYIGRDYGDEDGEYAGTDWESCHCWNPAHRLTLLPLPYMPRPWRSHGPTDPWATSGYSNEPPF